jgi:hypothetical protein
MLTSGLVEKIPNGKFWYEKSEFGSICKNDILKKEIYYNLKQK